MPTLHDEAPTVSGAFTFLMNAQLALILFLGLSWLYEQM
jgi:cytochrome c oxidase assembly factor CtaG